MRSLRLLFAGSPAAAVPTLDALIDSDHELVAVVTRPASLQGRRRLLTPTPVAVRAREMGVPVIEATRMSDAEQQVLGMAVDLGVIVAYGSIVREPVLSWPALGWINLHFSLLPRWRGAAPVQHAIIAGDKQTGVTVFQLTPGLDDGDWYERESTTIGAHRTAGGLLDDLSNVGAEVTRRVVDNLAKGTARARPQAGTPTLAPKLTRADAELNWAQTADAVDARLRGVTPEPGAFTYWGGTVLKIHDAVIDRDAANLAPGVLEGRDGTVRVGTATHPLALLRVQPAGRQTMAAADWFRGISGRGPERLGR